MPITIDFKNLPDKQKPKESEIDFTGIPDFAVSETEKQTVSAPVKNQAIADASVYGPMMGIDPVNIVADYDSFASAKEEIESTSLIDRWSGAWQYGKKIDQLASLGYRAMLGENLYREINKLKESIPSQAPAEYGLVEKSVSEALKMLPMMISGYKRGMKQGLTYGMGAAGIAAIAGQAGPQAALPEEIITVPSAFAAAFQAGTTAGMMYDIGTKEAGLAYIEMLEMEDENGNRIDPATVKAASAGVGVVNALLEMAQIKTLLKTIPGGQRLLSGAIKKTTEEVIRKKTIPKILTQAVKKYGGFLTAETAQEVAQESTNIIAGELAKVINNELEDSEIPPATRQEILDRIVEVAKSSALAFGAMGFPGSSINVVSNISQRQAKGATPKQIETSVNSAVPGHELKYKGFDAGFVFEATDPESDLFSATFTTQSLDPNEINGKIEEIINERKELEPENQQKIRDDIKKESQVADIQNDINTIKDEQIDRTEQQYETIKDIWIGKKDRRLFETKVEKRLLQQKLIDLYGERPASRKIAKRLGLTEKDKIYGELARKMDMAIHLHIDTKRDPEHIDEYYNDLTNSQKEIVDLSQNLPQEAIAIANEIERSYQEIGVEALDVDVIQNVLDNYAARMWDLGEFPSRELSRKFGAKTRHRHRRKYDTIIEAWGTSNREVAEGKRETPLKLKIKGATNNLAVLKEEIIKTIEDKKFLEDLKTLRDANGEKLVYTEQEAPEDFIKLDHPNLNSWKWSGKIDTPRIDRSNERITAAMEEYTRAANIADLKSVDAVEKFYAENERNIKKEAGREAKIMAEKDPIYSTQTEIIRSGGINRDSLVAAGVGKNDIAQLSKRRPGIINSEGRLKADELADENGYRDASDMVEKWISHPTKDEMISQLTDQYENEMLIGLDQTLNENTDFIVAGERARALSEILGDNKREQEKIDRVPIRAISGRNFFVNADGNVFTKQQLYAEPSIAKNLNKILGISKLANVPGLRTLTKYNAIFKQWLLLTSLFHHLAFMRSFYLPGGLAGKGMTPRQAYRQGIKAILALEPEVKLLVENGLTLGLQQEWEEHLVEEQTIIGTLIDKLGGQGVKQKIVDLRKLQTDFLFGSFGAGLKAKAALLELREHAKRHPELSEKEIARQVAEMVNNDFGGLHLQRLGRDPTLQHLFRLFALAPDWTESNVRTMIHLFSSKGETKAAQKAERELYRRFWVGVLWKGAAATVLANFALAGGDVEEMERRFKRAWKEGKFRWLMIDVTPIYRAFGGTKPDRKYFSFVGHFQDPLKFIAHPIISAKHKGSVISRIAAEAWTGSDWAGRRFTTLGELMTTGQTVHWEKGKGLEIEQFPSFVLHELLAVQPIQLQQLIGWLSGELDGFDALFNSLGFGVRTTYQKRTKPKV